MWVISFRCFLKLLALAYLFPLKSVEALPLVTDWVQWWANMKTLDFTSEKNPKPNQIKKTQRKKSPESLHLHIFFSLFPLFFRKVLSIWLNKRENLPILIFMHCLKNTLFSQIYGTFNKGQLVIHAQKKPPKNPQKI